MGDQFQILLQILYQPGKAFGRVLDQGSLIFAAVAAVIGNYAVGQALNFALTPYAAAALLSEPGTGPLTAVIGAWGFSGLIAVAALFVPTAIAISSQIEGRGSISVSLQRDYTAILMCALLAWTVASLALVVLLLAVGAGTAAFSASPILPAYLLAIGYFAFLMTFAIRTVTGTNSAKAAATVLGSLIAVALGMPILSLLRGFASPFLLLWIWLIWRPDFSGFTTGMRNRQAFQRHLQASTLNPRDSDAHYQLGLIYLQRRNLTDATERFEKARAIDPEDPDVQYELGRAYQQQDRHAEAKACFEAAAAIDDKLRSSDVWRDLGAANLALGDLATALPQLEKFTTRREYDAEGQFWYGEALRQAGRKEEARAAYQKSEEAARTAPSHLRRQVGQWGSRSRAALRGL